MSELGQFVGRILPLDKSFEPGDDTVIAIRGECGISSVSTTWADIKRVSIALLGDKSTAVGAAILVLNRRVYGGEHHITRILNHRNLTPESKFNLLVVLRTVEDFLKTPEDFL